MVQLVIIHFLFTLANNISQFTSNVVDSGDSDHCNQQVGFQFLEGIYILHRKKDN